MTYHWFSTKLMTVLVGAEDDVIKLAPPIVRKFKGQNLGNIRTWLKKQQGYKEVQIL